MGIFADILNPNNKKTAKEIIASTKPAGSTNLPIETTSTVKANANKILSTVKAGGSTPAPQPVIIPKKNEVIKQADNTNISTQMPVQLSVDEGKRLAEAVMKNNNYDPSSLEGIVKNTIKGIPKATTDVLVNILQATARAVGSVGITSGNAFTNALGIGPVFDDEIDTNQTEFSKILMGGKPVKTVQKSITDVREDYVKPIANKLGFDIGDTSSTIASVPFVLGGIALDLSGFGGKAGIKSFAEGEIPEAFLKFVAKEKSPEIIEQTLKKVGLDDINAKNLAFETAPTKTVDEVKNILINYGKEQQAPKGGAFSNILKGGDDVAESSVQKGITKQVLYKPEETSYFANLKKAIDESYNVDEDGVFDEDLVNDLIEEADSIGRQLGYNIDYDESYGGYEISLKNIKNINEAQDKVVKLAKSFDVDLKTNSDGTITLYHGTNNKNANSIINNGFDGGTFFSPSTEKDFGGVSGAAEYGDVILKADLDPRKLVFRTEGEFYYGGNKNDIKNVEVLGKNDPTKMSDTELQKFLKTPEGVQYAKKTQSNIPDKAKDKLFFDVNKTIKGVDNKPTVEPYKETGNLTTKILKDLEGKTTVSRQYIVDATKRQGISGSEVKIINDVLAKTKGDVIEVAKFAEKVKKDLIPLTVKKAPNAVNEAKRKLNELGYKFEKDMAGEAYLVDKDGDFIEYDELPESTKRLVDTAVGNAESFDEMKGNKYEAVALPKETRGDVKSYKENIYEGKIKTDGSPSHFGESDKYMLHTRVENMADGKTRRVIEVQSDLYQRGNLEKLRTTKGSIDRPTFARAMTPSDLEKYKEAYRINNEFNIPLSSNRATPEYKQKIYEARDTIDSLENKYFEIIAKDKNSDVSKLEQYKNPTIHYRGVREEIKKAVDDGIKTLQFPTGETAMKVEGLGSRDIFALIDNGSTSRTMLSPENAKVGMEVRRLGNDGRADNWIVTDVLEDGKFRAIPKSTLDWERQNGMFINQSITDERAIKELSEAGGLDRRTEQFDISGKVDTSNPIYKFYENDLAKYLKNNYDSKLVTDNKGVTWYEVDITKEMGGPVTAFKAVNPKDFNYEFDITPDQAQKSISKLFSPDEIKLITGDNIAEASGQGMEKFADKIQGFYKDQGDLGGLIGVIESGGKVQSATLFHESGHAFFNNFLSPADKKKYLDYVIKNKADELVKYENDSYPTDAQKAEEWIMDDFAREMRKDTQFTKTDGFFKDLYKRIVQTIKNILRKKTIFDDLYKRIKSKDRSYVKPKTRKLTIASLKRKEELPENLQRMKDLIDIKEEVLRDNPLNKLVKYQSKARLGELPELNDLLTKDRKGKFRQRGDVIIDEVMGYKYDYKDANDVEDVRAKFEKFMEEKKALKKMKEEFQSRRVDYYANKKAEISKKEMVEKDEKALERILNQQARETQDQIYKKERDDRLKVQLKETQKRLADEKAYKGLYADKVKEARTLSFKKDSYYQTIKNAINRSLKPVKLLDSKSKEIYKNWKTKLIIGKELANLDASSFKSVPVKDGMDVINSYEAGKVTEYTKDIKATFDSLRKEAIDRGLELGFRENYIPHVYKENAIEIKNAIANYMVDKGVEKYIIDDYMSGIQDLSPELASKLKLNPSFTKDRTLPTYKIASEYGLHPKYENPAQLVAYYRQEMEKTLANRDLMKKLEEEVKILPSSIAPKGWKEIELPYGKDRWFAKPELAQVINSEIGTRNTSEFGIAERFFYSSAKISKKMQEIALSAGVPKSNINFFSMGIAIKEMTSGNFKAISPFIRANFNNRSIEYFKNNRSVIKDMANQGIDISSRVGNYADTYNTLASKWNNKEYSELFGASFDKLFNEKTFGSFMPQLSIQTFKDASKKAINMGMSKEEADRFAGNVVRNMMGIIEDTGRNKSTEDALSTIFFAPKFRESIINVFMNTIKAGSTEFRNPEFYRNRRLIAGMILTFGLYNYLNYKLNGNYMWDNENGKEFALKIPTKNKNGDIVYIEYMPSQLSFIRSLASGFVNLLKGDLKTSAQKFGGLFSMPIKLTTDILTNSDYFGREIYKDTDTRSQKAFKIAKYIGLSVNHPYIKEIVNQIYDKKPIYQSISTALEFPLKFSTEDKVAQNRFYDAMDKARIEDIRAKEAFMPTYNKIVKLIDEEKDIEAQEVIDSLSDDEYEIYKNIKTAEKRSKTITNKTTFTSQYNDIISLKNSGDVATAQSMVDALSDEDYKSYESLKKQFNGKLAK